MGLNDSMADRIIARAIRLQRLSAGERLKVLGLHRELETDLTKLIIRIDPSGAAAPTYQVKRLRKLLEVTKETIRASYTDIKATHSTGMVQLARAEAEWFIKTAESEVGVNLLTKELSTQQMNAIASDVLIQGAPSKEWWGRQAGDLQQKFTDKIRVGMVQGKTTAEIVRTVRGTRETAFRDGIMETSRRQADALVRTSVQAVANEARGKLYEENQDIIKGLTLLATLDGRTTIRCIALNGLSWSLPDYKPMGHSKPWPGYCPLHWNCRSTMTAVFKSFAELAKPGAVPTEAGGRSNAQAIFERNLRESGMSEEKIAKALIQYKDRLDGEVPKELRFGDWLKGKDTAFQNDLLGKGRAQLWRDGKIGLVDLINQDARPLSLAELKEKYG